MSVQKQFVSLMRLTVLGEDVTVPSGYTAFTVMDGRMYCGIVPIMRIWYGYYRQSEKHRHLLMEQLQAEVQRLCH